MSLSYTAELELLVLDLLLPSYEKYQLFLGNKEPLRDINADLLSQIRKKRPIAALLRPYEPLMKSRLVFRNE